MSANATWPSGTGEMARLIRERDWAVTPLGATAAWPQALRSTVEMLVAHGFPMVALWGPDLIQIYNDGYCVIMADKHPMGLGQPTAQCWPEVWHINEPVYARVRAGQTVTFKDALFPLRRHGPVEDAWFTLTYSPLRDADGAIAGVLVTVFETTDRHLADRRRDESEERQAFLLELTDALRPLTEPGDIEKRATRLLGEHLKADRCFLSPVYPDGSGMCVREEYLRAGASSVLGDYTFAQFGDFVGPELHAGRILAVDNVAALTGLSAVERQSYATVEIGAYLLIPLIRDGRLAAFLTINHRTPRMWSDADKAVARQTADRLWTARERGRAEAARRESEARLAAAFEGIPVGAAIVDLAGVAVIANKEYRRFLPTGVVPSRDPARGERWRAWDAQGRPLKRHDFPSVRAMRGERVVPGREMLYTDDDGREIWTTVASVPTRDEHGRVTGLVTAIADIDVAKRSSEALRESEERFRQFGEASQDVLWIRDADTFQWEYLTPAFEAIYGLDRDAALRSDTMAGWLDLILSDDRERAEASMKRVRDGEWVTFEYRIRRPVDGAIRWLRNTDFPIRDAAGKVVRIGGIGHDVTDRKNAQDRQQVLVTELQHRTFNLMGVVGSMADATIRSSTSLDDFKARFRDRLDALARVQRLLSRLKEGERITFDELIHGELTAAGALQPEDGRVALDGPQGVALRSSTVQTFAMAVHELTTNAVKYGALKQDGARLEVRWRVAGGDDGQPWLHLAWIEKGVTMPAPGTTAQGTGQGRTLIEEALPYQLHARTTFEMAADGVHCTIALPVSQRTGDDRESARA